MTAQLGRLGVIGIDCNTPLTAATAHMLAQHGYEFAVRYVPRETQQINDCTRGERERLHAAGLGLMLVQHVESDREWIPSSEKGRAYGEMAVASAHRIGYATGATIWLDLEGVSAIVPPSITIAYCNRWFERVRAAGYRPGLYVGWHCGLSAYDLYWRLRFSAYWSGYNLNADEHPVVRGVQMRQRAAKPDDYPNDYPSGDAFRIDVNVITGDAMRGLPMLDVGDMP
jgi:hypothetical protein